MGNLGSIPGLGRSSGKGTATLSSVLACRIAWTEEPGRLQSVEWQRVRHDKETFTFTFIHTYDLSSFIHLVRGYLGFFAILAIVNNAAMNIRVHTSALLNVLILLEENYSGVEVLGHVVVLFLLFSNVASPVYIPVHNSAQVFV